MEAITLAILGILSTAVGALAFMVRNSARRNTHSNPNGSLMVEMRNLAAANHALLEEIRNTQRESLKVHLENQGMIREILERSRRG